MRTLLQASTASALLLSREHQGPVPVGITPGTKKCPQWTSQWCNQENKSDIIGLQACVKQDMMSDKKTSGGEEDVQCRATACQAPYAACRGPSLAEFNAVSFDAQGNKLTPAEIRQKSASVEEPATPAGIQSLDMAAAEEYVVCAPDVPDYFKLTFNSMMSCSVQPTNKQGESSIAGAPLCATYAEGGANDETTHDFCTKLFGSMEEYKKCQCKRWNSKVSELWAPKIVTYLAAEQAEKGSGDASGFEAQHFSDMVKLRSCPIVVQPRCLHGKMYRSECEALMANQDDTDKANLMAKMTVVAPAVWNNDVPETHRNGPFWEGPAARQACGAQKSASDAATMKADNAVGPSPSEG